MAERAALALAEAVTRLSDRPDPVSDEIWQEAARHYDEAGLASLIITIAAINVWNRFNVSTRQVAGPWTADAGSRAACLKTAERRAAAALQNRYGGADRGCAGRA